MRLSLYLVWPGWAFLFSQHVSLFVQHEIRSVMVNRDVAEIPRTIDFPLSSLVMNSNIIGLKLISKALTWLINTLGSDFNISG